MPDPQVSAAAAAASDAAAAPDSAATSDAAKLEQAQESFRLGDYARVTSIAGALSKSDDPAIVDAATALLVRLSTPPLTKYLLGLTLLLLLASTWFAFAQ